VYRVDRRDKVVELGDVPQSSIGAPLPTVVADEHRVFLIYLLEILEPGWDGSTVRVVDADSSEPAAIVEFEMVTAHTLGPPNDEAFAGHPLAARGLKPYTAFRIDESSWLRGLERMNRVHEYHDRKRFMTDKNHYVFAFHNSIFECVARCFTVNSHPGPPREAVASVVGRLG
jgi:hypothetical protein